MEITGSGYLTSVIATDAPFGPDWCSQPTASNPEAGRWYYAVLIHKIHNITGSTFYLNGVFNGTKTTCSGNLISNSKNVLIGARSPSDRLINGTVEEVMIFDRALSSQEVLDLYNLQKPFVSSSLPPFILFWEWVKGLLISIVS